MAKIFLCQNRPTTRKRVYFDGHTVPKFAWYGQLADGTRFIAVKNGKLWGIKSHHGLETWSNEIVPDVLNLIATTDRVNYASGHTTEYRTHERPAPVVRNHKSKSRITSRRVEDYKPHVQLSREYRDRSVALYGNTVEINGKKYAVDSTRISTYFDGTGMGGNFDNSDRRPLEQGWHQNSYKNKK